jgi:hypothetical protein
MDLRKGDVIEWLAGIEQGTHFQLLEDPVTEGLAITPVICIKSSQDPEVMPASGIWKVLTRQNLWRFVDDDFTRWVKDVRAGV